MNFLVFKFSVALVVQSLAIKKNLMLSDRHVSVGIIKVDIFTLSLDMVKKCPILKPNNFK